MNIIFNELSCAGPIIFGSTAFGCLDRRGFYVNETFLLLTRKQIDGIFRKGERAMLFIVIVLSIPIYGYCIWSLYEPEEAYFFMDKWRYKEVPELSDLQLKYIRYSSIAVISLMTVGILALAIHTAVSIFRYFS